MEEKDLCLGGSSVRSMFTEEDNFREDSEVIDVLEGEKHFTR